MLSCPRLTSWLIVKDEYERKYKERIAKLDAEKLEIPGRTPANGGWQEVGPLPSEAPTVKQVIQILQILIRVFLCP